MKILVLQLKRIGDLVLTTPALSALRQAHPDAEITLLVAGACTSLLPAIDGVQVALAYRPGAANGALWTAALGQRFDACLDFTGTDRSALLCGLSRATKRVAFASASRSRVRGLAYNENVESAVREHHTEDHYLNLLGGLGITPATSGPTLRLPEGAANSASTLLASVEVAEPFLLLHPGTARPEKYWLVERWVEVLAQLRAAGGRAVITAGPDRFEQAHAAAISAASGVPLLQPPDLLTLTALLCRAALVVSCDTSVVHLTAAFRRPQIALFGPTNPFHWRPRHPDALILSAAQPGAPLREFTPRMKGAPMERISTALVFDAISSVRPLFP